MLLQELQIHNLQSLLMSSRKGHWACHSCRSCILPGLRADAPPIAGGKSGETVLGHRGNQIVPLGSCKLQELLCNDATNRVSPRRSCRYCSIRPCTNRSAGSIEHGSKSSPRTLNEGSMKRSRVTQSIKPSSFSLNLTTKFLDFSSVGLKAISPSEIHVRGTSPTCSTNDPDEGPEGDDHTCIDMLGPEQDMGPRPPVLIGMAIDVVHQQEESFLAEYGYTEPWVQLQVLAGITVAIWVLESLFQYFYGVLWRNLAQTAQHELRMDAYRHIQDLEMQWFSEQSTGGLMAIMNDDVNQLERFLDHGANDLLQVGTTVIVVSGIMFYLAPEVALLAIIPVPVIVGGSFLYQRRIGVRYTEVRKEVAELNAILNNNLQGITTTSSRSLQRRGRLRESATPRSPTETQTGRQFASLPHSFL